MAERAYAVEETDNDERWGRVLVGPNGWRCYLQEPEDCNWIRDGRPAVDRLNQQAERIAELEDALRLAVYLAKKLDAAMFSEPRPSPYAADFARWDALLGKEPTDG